MLRDNKQMMISEYESLYEKIIPKDNILRKIKENIDFSFVNGMLKKSYCENFGRPAKEPEMMFKLLFLKKLYDLSDEKLIENASMHMGYKYFLDLEPEAEMIDSSLLTKFRKTRITEEILEDILKETIIQAIDKKLIKSTAIMVDATHIKANTTSRSPTEILRQMTKLLRKEIYKEMYDLIEKLPEKPTETSNLDEEINYSQQLINNTRTEIANSGNIKIQEIHQKIEELLKDEKIRKIRSIIDCDAKFGHKSPTSTFFGYKAHLAVTDEQIITGIEVTSGDGADSEQFQKLIHQSIESGIEVKEVLGDKAYSAGKNIEYCEEKNIQLVSALNTVISNSQVPKNDGFIYNKDAATLQCQNGLLAKSFVKREGKNEYSNSTHIYSFNKISCKQCPLNKNCKVGQSKTKSYAISIATKLHEKQLEFEKSEYFKLRSVDRYKIEAKHAELKNAHGLNRADSVGLYAMRLQTYITAFVVNAKRIVKLTEQKVD